MSTAAAAPRAGWDASRSAAGRHNPWLITVILSIATFMEVLDTSIANVALRYIAGHSAEDLARLAPPPARDDAADYVAALRESKAGFTADGAMPPQGPETAMRVLTVADRAVRGKRIDLARTWTGEFVADVR